MCQVRTARRVGPLARHVARQGRPGSATAEATYHVGGRGRRPLSVHAEFDGNGGLIMKVPYMRTTVDTGRRAEFLQKVVRTTAEGLWRDLADLGEGPVKIGLYEDAGLDYFEEARVWMFPAEKLKKD